LLTLLAVELVLLLVEPLLNLAVLYRPAVNLIAQVAIELRTSLVYRLIKLTLTFAELILSQGKLPVSIDALIVELCLVLQESTTACISSEFAAVDKARLILYVNGHVSFLDWCMY